MMADHADQPAKLRLWQSIITHQKPVRRPRVGPTHPAIVQGFFMRNDMRTSPYGVALLPNHETVVPSPYLDGVGVWTFGIGHTATTGAPISPSLPRGMLADLVGALAQVFEVFRYYLVRYEASVTSALERMPMTQAQFDAAVLFHFDTEDIGHAVWFDLWRRGGRCAIDAAMVHPARDPRTPRARGQLVRDARLWLRTDRPLDGLGRVIRTLNAGALVTLIGHQPAAVPPDRLPTIR